MTRRSLAVLAVLAATGLTACGPGTPPAKELAEEAVDSLLNSGYITEQEATCMHGRLAEYSRAELDEIAESAENGSPEGLGRLEQFQADLAECRAG